jgi:hypothetical protein
MPLYKVKVVPSSELVEGFNDGIGDDDGIADGCMLGMKDGDMLFSLKMLLAITFVEFFSFWVVVLVLIASSNL